MLSDKSNIVQRAGKGSPLTHIEMDTNLNELRNVIDDVTNILSDSNGVLQNAVDARDSASGYAIDALTLKTEVQSLTIEAQQAVIDAAAVLASKVSVADQADSADPLKGAGAIGRSTVVLASIADLQTAKQDASQLVYVAAMYSGVYASATPYTDKSSGVFKWSPAVPRNKHDVGTIISPTVPWNGTQATLSNYLNAVGETTPAGLGCWVRIFTGPVNVLWFGAVGDGTTNDYAACVKAHSTGYNVHYSANLFLVSSASGIQISPGTTVTGEGSGRFSGVYKKSKTTLRNDQTNGGIFWYTNDSSTGQKEAVRLFSMELLADNPIRMNPLDGVVADGGGSNIPYLMKFVMYDVSLAPVNVGVGIGCALTKVFDGSITQCDFRSFGTQLLLQGCDINMIKNNRFTLIYDYGILELGVATFGSQNQIELNDIVTAMSVNAVFIKTSGRHPRIIDNYLEQGVSGVGICKGFIDISATGIPVYGANTPSTTRFQSVIVEKNRIDGKAKATNLIYNYEPIGVQAKIHDVGTSGPLATLSWLTIEGEELPLFANTTNGCLYDFFGGTQINDKWKSFKNSSLDHSGGTVSFSAQSLLSLNQSELRRNNNHLNVRLTPSGFVLKPALTTVFNCIFPIIDSLNNKYLASGVTYNVTVVARAKSGTPTLRVAKLVNLAVQGSVIDTVLNTQDKAIKFTMTGGLTSDNVGLGFLPVSASTDIEISSVTFSAV